MTAQQHHAESPFVDAQEMHRLHPDTFEAPSLAELHAIAPGTAVKVCAQYERFWVLVETVDHDDDTIAGHIDNDLLCTAKHGFSNGNRVVFRRCHVYQIAPPAKP